MAVFAFTVHPDKKDVRVAISKQNFLLSALLSASTGLLLIQAGRTIASLANRGVTCTPRCALDLAAVAVRVKSVGRQLAASILFLAVMALTDAPCSRQPRIMLGKIREHWPTYHYKSGFNGRLGDLAVRPVWPSTPLREWSVSVDACAQ